MTTATVGIRDLTHNAGSLVRAAANGERFVITDRGRPIAELVPHSSPEARARRQAIETERVNAMLELVGQKELEKELEWVESTTQILDTVEW